MYRNVTPIKINVSSDRDIALREVEQVLLKKGVVQSGDMVALTVGEPMGEAGGTNTLKIIKVK